MMNQCDGGVLAGALSKITSELDHIQHPAILVIGDVALWRAFAHNQPLKPNISLESFECVTTELIATFKPDVVVSPLMWLSFDCIDLALVLQSCGFEGQFHVMTPPLPNPKVVLAELATACPSVQAKFMTIADPICVG